MAPNTEEFKKLNKEFLLVNARLKELRSGSVKTSGIFSKLGKAAMGVVAMFQIASKAIRTIANAVSAVVSKIADFEQANANLATILGKREIKAINACPGFVPFSIIIFA